MCVSWEWGAQQAGAEVASFYKTDISSTLKLKEAFHKVSWTRRCAEYPVG
jgi:hypothetical protein